VAHSHIDRFSVLVDLNTQRIFRDIQTFIITIVCQLLPGSLTSVKSCKSRDADHKRRSLRVSLIAALHCSFQNDLTCRLKIAHDTIISTIDRRNFRISFTQMSISRIVIENYSVNACFIAYLILFRSMSFHALRTIREKFDFVSQRTFVEMRMWFDD
jgi:hypothetical protein